MHNKYISNNIYIHRHWTDLRIYIFSKIYYCSFTEYIYILVGALCSLEYQGRPWRCHHEAFDTITYIMHPYNETWRIWRLVICTMSPYISYITRGWATPIFLSLSTINSMPTIYFSILLINNSNLSFFDISLSHFTEYFKLSINIYLNMLNSFITELTFCWYLIKFLSFQMTH